MAFKMKGHTLPGPNQRKPSPVKAAFLAPLGIALKGLIAKGLVAAGGGLAAHAGAAGGAKAAAIAAGKGALVKGGATTVGGTALSKATSGSRKRKTEEKINLAQHSKMDALKMQQESMTGDIGTRGRIV